MVRTVYCKCHFIQVREKLEEEKNALQIIKNGSIWHLDSYKKIIEMSFLSNNTADPLSTMPVADDSAEAGDAAAGGRAWTGWRRGGRGASTAYRS